MTRLLRKMHGNQHKMT